MHQTFLESLTYPFTSPPAIDGMTVGELKAHLKAHWPGLREQLLQGEYKPKPVKRVLDSVERFLAKRLRLEANRHKAVVARPQERKVCCLLPKRTMGHV